MLSNLKLPKLIQWLGNINPPSSYTNYTWHFRYVVNAMHAQSMYIAIPGLEISSPKVSSDLHQVVYVESIPPKSHEQRVKSKSYSLHVFFGWFSK